MERGDLNEMSFAFMPTVQEWDESGETPLRKIKEAELFDVAIVTYPAYNSTEIGLRSLKDVQDAKPSKNYRNKRLLNRQAESGLK
jgi:HK97 family phage prohead protease